MCGRFCLCDLPPAIRKKLALTAVPSLIPRYNIAPTQKSLVILQQENRDPEIQNLYWGLIPSWAKDKNIGIHSINARAESIDGKPSFRDAFKQRRCLVPANGFYEWTKSSGKVKTPYYFTNADADRPVMFAGLWEDWRSAHEHIRSFTIITTGANDLMRPIHDRIPVIIAPGNYERWLDARISTREKLDDLLYPADNGYLTVYEITPYVNDVRHEGERCLEPVNSLF